ncbi:TfoX/Sxy family protein [Chloroflexota bacterium]
MAADKVLLNHVMDLLAPLDGISDRAMFGGFGIFHEGDMFALITNSGLHFKVNETNLGAYQEAGSKQFKPMPYYEVPADCLDDRTMLLEWAKISIAIGHATAKKKR